MKGFCPLASGSKGNCTYIGTEQTKILLDAGLSGKAIVSKLAEINVDITEIDAIVVTHEHRDHIQGLRVLAYRMGIPIFANNETAKGIVDTFHDCPKFKIFATGETFEFGDIEFHPFSIQHDTLDPVAFTLKINSMKLGFCTDLGFATTLVENRLQECDYLVLESNHEPAMVHACSRPMVYKQRVLGRCGHLSNQACSELLNKVWSPRLKKVYLAHLSEECNSPQSALDAARKTLNHLNTPIELQIAHQAQISRPTLFEETVPVLP